MSKGHLDIMKQICDELIDNGFKIKVLEEREPIEPVFTYLTSDNTQNIKTHEQKLCDSLNNIVIYKTDSIDSTIDYLKSKRKILREYLTLKGDTTLDDLVKYLNSKQS